jgi:hypothetical protein
MDKSEFDFGGITIGGVRYGLTYILEILTSKRAAVVEELTNCREQHKATNDPSWLERHQRLEDVLKMMDATLDATVADAGPFQA